MKQRLLPFALPALFALAACQPGIAEYTKAQAPGELTVAGAVGQYEFRFAPGSDRLFPGESAHLARLIAIGTIRPEDRVTIAAAGPPALAARRRQAIARVLLRRGIVALPVALADLPPNRALLEIGRYTVELPPCPNWSQRPYSEFTNQPSSNYGCATAVDLGLMAASPADLAAGRPLAPADGAPAVSAVRRYLQDKAYPSVSPGTPTPFSGGASGGGGGSGGGASGNTP
ncbi:MAG TPA: CpaD family pilus assembly lipoprotein [Stellaceae bacterium]|nr:CpaD family pilus assembly lipoprotein [Stellaceae bacterium]